MKKIYLILVVAAISSKVSAQNDFQYSHYMMNSLTYNPAVAGSTNNLEVSLLARKQWYGMSQSPTSQVLNAHTYLEKIKGGVGVTILNDKLGNENSLNIKGNYAYHQKLNKNSGISAGVSVGFLYKSIDATKLVFDDAGDVTASNALGSKVKPDFNFGLEYSNKNLIIGASTTHINQSLNKSTVFQVPRHYFLYAKYMYGVTDKVDIVPSFLIKSSVFITQFELNTNVIYDKKYWLGFSYRNKEAYVALIGLQINNMFKVGYSYDFNAGIVKSYSSGSHEIFLTAALPGFNKKKYHLKTPRFFN